MRLQDSLLIGLATAFAVYFTVNFFGSNYYTWLLQMTAYVIVAAIIYLKTAENNAKNSLHGFSDRLLYVVDKEERKVKKLLTGEEFKIKNTEKVQ